MKLWLDDVRPAPKGWEHARTADEAIEFLTTALNIEERIEEVSLDHDLGADPADGIYARGMAGRCGCFVVDWLVNRRPFVLHPIRIHSWNGEEARRMARNLNDVGYDVELRPYSVTEFRRP